MATPTHIASLRTGAPFVLPSLLLCDFGHLADEVRRLEQAGVKALHLDVMDGQFVPNLSYGMPIVEAIRKVTELPLDVHLMIAKPGDYVKAFCEAGADIITFHIESEVDPAAALAEIHRHSVAAGLVINPQTPVSAIAEHLSDCEIALVMSVQAGFGGQSFQSQVLAKIGEIRQLGGADLLIEIDGGINRETIGAASSAGADLFVAGSAIFKADDYTVAVRDLTRLAAEKQVDRN